MVSEDPMSTDAARPAKLSGPSEANSSFIMAVAALPDIGRMKMTGNMDSGMPNGRKSVPKMPHKSCKAPLAANMRVAQMSKIRLGKIRKLVDSPSRAPLINSQNRSFPENSMAAPASVMMIGTA